MRVRYYGLLANRKRKTLLARCRELLGVTQPTDEPGEKPLADTCDRELCSVCGIGRLQLVECLFPAAPTLRPMHVAAVVPSPTAHDSS